VEILELQGFLCRAVENTAANWPLRSQGAERTVHYAVRETEIVALPDQEVLDLIRFPAIGLIGSTSAVRKQTESEGRDLRRSLRE
jgi:hypothetical protein